MKSIYMVLAVILITALSGFCGTSKDLTLSNRPIRFAIIGDRTGGHVPGVYEEIVAEVERLRPDFVMTVGDAIEGYTEDTTTLNTQWNEYLSIVKPLTMPIYFTPGNHDITTDPALGPFHRFIGDPYYSFNVGKYHFVVLDVSRWESSEELPKEELAWLAKDLAGHRDAAQTLVFYHKPFWYDSIVMGKPDTLHSLFKTYGVDAVFNGHLHSYFSARLDGILYNALGSSGGITDQLPTDLDYHFTWVTVDDTSINIAPIKKGSVKAWDAITASDEHAIDNIHLHCAKFTKAAYVRAYMGVDRSSAQLEITNTSKQTLNDTILWQIPAGWSIKPANLPVIIQPGEKGAFDFAVSNNGNLYPVPTASFKVPYAEGKEISLSEDLRIARRTSAEFAKKPPVIDGKLDDFCWQPIESIPANKALPQNYQSILFNPDGGLAQIESTYFYFACDDSNLYLAAHCLESKMDSLHGSVTQRDGGVFGEDCVGFFLQPDLEKDTAYQIYFNPIGTVYDAKLQLGSLGYFYAAKSWNGLYTVKTRWGKNYWDIEACIPLSQLNATVQSGMNWGVNFLRKQKRLNASADWQVPIDYDPKTFGQLEISGP
jgi:hypothetical protein